MKSRPILFKGEMVRAILSGQKTQTRRIMKPQPYGNGFMHNGELLTFNDYLPPSAMLLDCKDYTTSDVEGLESECPYGQVGDQLWVRETWAEVGSCDPGWLFYKASDYLDQVHAHGLDRYLPESDMKWKPSIHMPRRLSRITLEITNVRVERLQDISEADAIAEGVGKDSDGWFDYLMPTTQSCLNAKDSYRTLWESINGPGSWDANPWVWVVEFKRIKP